MSYASDLTDAEVNELAWLRSGSLRYKNNEGLWVVCAPRDPMFSTTTMLAEEYYDGESWQPIDLD